MAAPPTRRQKRDPAAGAAAPAIDPADRLSSLPDEVLAHILSLLPAQEAVRTCVLARAWRDAWKLTKRLLITGRSVPEARGFAAALLDLRLRGLERASLDACEIRFHLAEADDEGEDEGEGEIPAFNHDEHMSCVDSWIRLALRCQVKALRVDMVGDRRDLEVYLQMQMSTRPLASPHLAKLDLRGVSTVCRHLDFSGCPALEQLEISDCNFWSMRKMTSPSLRRLLVTSCESADDPCRFQICAPRLVSLRMEHNDFRNPLLESMPELVEAYVQIGPYQDYCSCDDPMGCYHVTRGGHISESELEEMEIQMIMLNKLRQSACFFKYIIRRDLRWCPTFSKLKTLVIDDHLCGPADCSGLACILENAPFLEKLTVIIISREVRGKYKVEVKGCLDPTVKSTKASHHLRIVDIKCEMINEKVLNILNFLGTLNICFQIRVIEK